jgi:hypothetical protein
MAMLWDGQLRNQGSIPGRVRGFSVLHNVEIKYGAHLASYPVDTRGSFPEVDELQHVTDNSCPSSAKVMNPWSYT